MSHVVFQLRCQPSEQQRNILRDLYGDDGSTRNIEPRSPAELCDILQKVQGETRPVVVLNHQPLPAAAMGQALAEFVTFETPNSDLLLRVRQVIVEVEGVKSGQVQRLYFPAN